MTVVCVPAPATVTPAVIDPRVQRGAELLDERMPGWAEKIDLDAFDLGSPGLCILGQVGLCVFHTAYVQTVERLFNITRPFRDISDEEMTHGFVAETDDDADWDLLEADWRLAILSRRQA